MRRAKSGFIGFTSDLGKPALYAIRQRLDAGPMRPALYPPMWVLLAERREPFGLSRKIDSITGELAPFRYDNHAQFVRSGFRGWTVPLSRRSITITAVAVKRI